MRADLSVPQQAVQAIHAAVEVARSGLIASAIEHPNLVLCTVDNEDAIHRIAQILSDDDVAYRVFHESDMSDQATALCTEPLDRASMPQPVSKCLRNLSLMGSER